MFLQNLSHDFDRTSRTVRIAAGLVDVAEGEFEPTAAGCLHGFNDIDAETFTIEKQFNFELGDRPSEVQLNGNKDKLYWINDDIWEMDVIADKMPSTPFLPYNGTIYYGLTVCPRSGVLIFVVEDTT